MPPNVVCPLYLSYLIPQTGCSLAGEASEENDVGTRTVIGHVWPVDEGTRSYGGCRVEYPEENCWVSFKNRREKKEEKKTERKRKEKEKKRIRNRIKYT